MQNAAERFRSVQRVLPAHERTDAVRKPVNTFPRVYRAIRPREFIGRAFYPRFRKANQHTLVGVSRTPVLGDSFRRFSARCDTPPHTQLCDRDNAGAGVARSFAGHREFITSSTRLRKPPDSTLRNEDKGVRVSQRRLFFPFLPLLFFPLLRAGTVSPVSLARPSRNPPEADLWTRKSLSIFRGLTFDPRKRSRVYADGGIFLRPSGKPTGARRGLSPPLDQDKFFFYRAVREEGCGCGCDESLELKMLAETETVRRDGSCRPHRRPPRWRKRLSKNDLHC